MSVKELNQLNPRLHIREVTEQSFSRYGKIVSGYDFTELIDFMERETSVPEEGNIYRASVSEMEQLAVYEQLAKGFYGEMPVQIGYCNGRNSTLNGLEYHIGSEINIAATDFVLLLGLLQDVAGDSYQSEKVEAFFVHAGIALQLYETTLHFAPCKTVMDGFKCIVVLPRGTNEPLENDKARYGDNLLFARNKWLLAHPDRKPLMENGAWPGIVGENVKIMING